MPYYCVRTKSRQEEIARLNLEQQGYPSYFPLIVQDQRLKSTKYGPMFPTYGFIFAEPGQTDFRPIQHTRGVLGLIKFGGSPAPVKSSVIEALRAYEDENGVHRPQKVDYTYGDRVIFNEGAWEHIEGIFYKTAGERVIILLNILGAEQKVTANRSEIRPVYA